MSEVCRFFLQGKCRYGARCRYLHQRDSRDGSSGGFGGRNTTQYNNRSYERPGHGGGRESNRFDNFNSESWGQRGGGARGRGNFGSHSRDSGYGHRGPSGGDYGHRKPFQDQKRPFEDQRRPFEDQRRPFEDQKRPFEDQRRPFEDQKRPFEDQKRPFEDQKRPFEDQKRPFEDQRKPFEDRRRDRYRDDGHSSGLSGDGGHGNTGQAEPNSPEELAQVIREDMEIWTQSQMWPFSCYSCQKEGTCLPKLTDISPEELRWKAYRARSDPTSQGVYQEELKTLHEQVASVRREMMAVTASSVRDLLSGKSSGTSESLFGRLAPSTAAPSIFPPSSSSSSSPFSHTSHPHTLFPTPPQTQQQTSIFATDDKRSAVVAGSLFSSPPSSGSASVSATKEAEVNGTVSSTNQQTAVISPTHTVKELQAFKSEHFTLGKIPEKPPPPELA